MSSKAQTKKVRKSKASQSKATVTISKSKKSPSNLDLELGVYTPHITKPVPYHDINRYKSTYEKLTSEERQLVDMVLDPDSVDSAVRWPNTYGLSSVYKSVNTINAAFDANKQSIVYAHPRLTNAIFSTAGNQFTQTLVPSGTSAGNFVYQDIGLNEDTNQSAYLTAPWYFPSNHVALPMPANSPAGQTNFLYPIGWSSTDVTAVCQFLFTNIGLGDVGQLSMIMRWYDTNLVQLANQTLAVQANGVCQFTINPSVGAPQNNTFYVSFQVIGAQHPYTGRVLGQFREVGAGPFLGVTLFNVYTHCIAANLNGAALVTGSSEEYMVLAQSLLCTHVGSTLADGGVCATGRVAADTVVGEKSEAGSDSAAGGNSHYNWIASLPNNRYDGKVKNGCYSFYLGDDERSYFYRPVQENVDDLPYLVAAFNTTDNSPNIVRIKIVTHIQFKSNSNVFAQLPSPYMRDINRLPHIMSVINSSYSNDGHKLGLKDHLKNMGKAVGKVLMSPKTYMTIAEILAMLA